LRPPPTEPRDASAWQDYLSAPRSRPGKGIELTYSIPKEGTIDIIAVLAIPVDAPHPRTAHLFINYLLRPDVAARNSNAVKYANPVPASTALLTDALKNDPGVYPPPEVRAKMAPERVNSQQFMRLLTRTWTRFKTGQ
jgi:putrescine transport system substrate-binding protein